MIAVVATTAVEQCRCRLRATRGSTARQQRGAGRGVDEPGEHPYTPEPGLGTEPRTVALQLPADQFGARERFRHEAEVVLRDVAGGQFDQAVEIERARRAHQFAARWAGATPQFGTRHVGLDRRRQEVLPLVVTHDRLEPFEQRRVIEPGGHAVVRVGAAHSHVRNLLLDPPARRLPISSFASGFLRPRSPDVQT
jgi:hypothetical protein